MPQANRKIPKPARTNNGKKPSTAPRFTENRKLPVRTTERSAIELYDNTKLIWKLLLVSLPIDLLVVSLELRIALSPSLLSFLELASLAGLSIAALFLLRDSMIDGLDKLEAFQHRAMKFSIAHSKAIFFVIAAVTTVEIIFHVGGFGIIAIIPASILALRASRAIKKSLGEHHERFLAFERDQVLLLNSLNKRLFTLSITPLVFARVASLCAAVAVLATSHSIGAWLPYGGAALVLLCTFFPQEEDFVIRCRKCSRWTSRALKSKGYCPVCSREEFQLKEMPEQAAAVAANKKTSSSQVGRLKALNQFFTRVIASAKGASIVSPPSTPKPPGLSKS